LLCPGGDYKKFLDAYLVEQGEPPLETPGEMVTTDGRVIGEHTGIHNFTVGQRKGLGVATGSPLYVLQIKGRHSAGYRPARTKSSTRGLCGRIALI